jgi:hypothetical protein
MRTITAGLFISLDGVVEAPDQWHFPYSNRSQPHGNGFCRFEPFPQPSGCHRLPTIATARLHKCSIPLRGLEDRGARGPGPLRRGSGERTLA